MRSLPRGRVDYRFVYVDQAGYEANPPKTFAGLVNAFTDYQD
jgi:type III restriction enzyme